MPKPIQTDSQSSVIQGRGSAVVDQPAVSVVTDMSVPLVRPNRFRSRADAARNRILFSRRRNVLGKKRKLCQLPGIWQQKHFIRLPDQGISDAARLKQVCF